jgi:uncharacterized membrane protein
VSSKTTRPKVVRLEPIVSRMSVGGHPIHPVLVHFPVAALIGLMGTDAAYLFTGDFFWARAGLWLAGVGAVGGTLASIAGLVDLVVVPRIRRLITAWSHSVLAVLLLSLASFNWLLRIDAPDARIVPWGLYVSFLTASLIGLTGLLGGRLVYEYAVGVDVEEATHVDPEREPVGSERQP